MNPRLIILLVVLAGAVCYVVVKGPRTKTVPASDGGATNITTTDGDGRPHAPKQTLSEMDLPGEDPGIEPELYISVRIDPSDGKNRLYYEITEKNGLFVETFHVRYYFTPTDGGPADRIYVFTDYVSKFLKANDTLASFVDTVDAEIDSLGGDMGTTENWSAEISGHGRARLENPEPSWPGWLIDR